MVSSSTGLTSQGYLSQQKGVHVFLGSPHAYLILLMSLFHEYCMLSTNYEAPVPSRI